MSKCKSPLPRALIGVLALAAIFCLPASSQTNYRVLVAFSSGAAGQFQPINTWANLIVQETNQGYINSGINARMVLARSTGTYGYTLELFETFATIVDRLRLEDGYIDELLRMRDEYAADAVIYVTNNDDQCGRVFDIGITEDLAYAVVGRSCATAYYSPAHEIGHLFGARHDVTVDNTNTPFQYGHGYKSANNDWRTIMAFNCTDSDGCPRLQYFSNPSVTHPGTGQPMGTAGLENVARVHNERATAISNFRAPPGNQTLSSNINVGEYGEVVATNSVTMAQGFQVDRGQLIIQVGIAGLGKKGATEAIPEPGNAGQTLDETGTSFPIKFTQNGLEIILDLADGTRIKYEIFDFNGRRITGKSVRPLSRNHPLVIPSSHFNAGGRILRISDSKGNPILQRKIAHAIP